MKKTLLALSSAVLLLSPLTSHAVYYTVQGGTGSTSPSGILYGDNSATNHLNTVIIGSNLTFSGGTLSASGGGSTFPFTVNTGYNSTTTVIGFNGLFSTASSTFVVAPIFSSLTGILKGNGSTALTVAANGTDYTLITANSCGAGQHVSAITAAGSITCSADTGGSGIGTVSTSSQETLGQLAAWGTTNGYPAKLYSVATSSTGAGTGLTFSGTAGAQVGGTSGTYSVNTSQNISTLSNLTTNGFVITSGGTGALSVQQFPATIVQGGTGTTTAPSGQLIYGGGAGVYQSVATTSVTCSGNTSCNPFTVIGTSPITISSTGGGTGLATTTPISPGNVLWYNGTGAGSASGVATSSLTFSGPFNGLSTLGALVGGTNSTVTYYGLATSSNIAAASGFLYATGANTVASVATSSAIQMSITGNAGTATALAGNGSNCAAGFFPLGVDASGVSESCTYAFATTTPWSTGLLAVSNTGLGYTIASSSLFGYTPLNPTRQLTISSANGQIVLSAGAQDLSADRTWTVTYTGISTSTAMAANQIVYGTAANTVGSEAAFTYNPSTDLFTTTLASTTQFSAASQTFYVDSTGKISAKDVANSFTGRLSPTRSFVLQTGTSTSWTASTTNTGYSPTMVMPFAGTIQQVRCKSDSFLGVNVIVNGSNATPSYFVASSTVGTEKFTAGNTFTAGQTVVANFGTTTTATATYVSCTFDVTETI